MDSFLEWQKHGCFVWQQAKYPSIVISNHFRCAYTSTCPVACQQCARLSKRRFDTLQAACNNISFKNTSKRTPFKHTACCMGLHAVMCCRLPSKSLRRSGRLPASKTGWRPAFVSLLRCTTCCQCCRFLEMIKSRRGTRTKALARLFLSSSLYGFDTRLPRAAS